MPKLIALALLALTFLQRAQAIPPTSEPSLAMVRIKSHGASATVIASQDGKSYLLGCAHMIMNERGGLDKAALDKTLKMDGPSQPYAKPGPAKARIIAYDLKLDLSLIELDNGPFHHIPVAKKGHKPSKNIRSLGYDNMAWPVTDKPATIIKSESDTTYTVEKPWHGRSGGGLIDGDNQCLIGVVQGYEVHPTQRGLYVSHEAVLRFLDKHFPAPQEGKPPQNNPPKQYSRPQLWQQPFPGGC